MWNSQSSQATGIRDTTRREFRRMAAAASPRDSNSRARGILGALEAVLRRDRSPLRSRQEFLNQPAVLGLMLLLLTVSVAAGLDLYHSGAALPLVAGWFLLPSIIVIGLMFEGLRPVVEHDVHWEVVEVRVAFHSHTPTLLQRPPAARAR